MANFYGSSGNDSITGSGSNDYISGGDGNDTIYGLDGADLIMGGRGNDVILGGNGRDTIYGDPGDDTIRVTDASDYSTSAGDVIDGGEGTDYIYAETTNSSGSLCTIRLGQVSFVEWLVNTTNKTLTIEGAGYIDVSTINSILPRAARLVRSGAALEMTRSKASISPGTATPLPAAAAMTRSMAWPGMITCSAWPETIRCRAMRAMIR